MAAGNTRSIQDAARGRWRHILAHLSIEVPQTPKQHGPCPTCGGKDRFRFDDLDGRGTWFCNQCIPQAGDGFALVQNVKGCGFSEALQLVAGVNGHAATNGHQGRRIVETYDYTNAMGSPLYQAVRFDPKDFRQRRPDGNGRWVWGLEGVGRVLYRLPALLQVADSPIVLHEGEKAVEAAVAAGLPGVHTTTAGGANAAKRTDFSAVKGREVIICPDQDERGERYLRDVADMATAAGASFVKVLRLPGLPPKGDVVEWLQAGGTPEQFKDLLIQAEPVLAADGATMSSLLVPSPGEWPEIQPIKAELAPVPPLPLEIVPSAFRGMVKDVSERMQCPPDYVATAMIVMAGSIIGAGCGIRPKKNDDWTVVPNLWGGVVGRPSMLKTPAISEAMKPLEKLESLAKQAYDEALKKHDAEVEAFKAQKEALQADMRKVAKGIGKPGKNMDDIKQEFRDLTEPDRPVWRRYKTNDATVEKMAELQAENPRGLLVFRDELIGLLATWDKDGHESDRAFFLEGFNGQNSYTADRIGRGHIYTPSNTVSLFGGIQPAKLTGYLYAAMRGHNNDGFVQRLQMCVYPDEPSAWKLIDRPIDAYARQTAHHAVQHMADMDFRQCGAYGDENERTPYYRFSDEGQVVFNEFLTELEMKLRSQDDEPVILEHLGKYRSLMPSLALIFHLLDLASNASPVSAQISARHAEYAAAWCGYLEAHARRIYGLVTNATQQAAARLAEKLQKKGLPNPFTVRDVYRKNWSCLHDRELIENACDELVSLGWLKEQESPPAFRKKGKTEYWINPKVSSYE
ncbi:MAG: DUF3987 domain-containing protein [Nitrospira sp.]